MWRRVLLAAMVVPIACSDPDRDGNGGTISVGQLANASLTSTDNAIPAGRSAPYNADAWTLTLASGDTVTITMCAVTTAIDPYLQIDLGSTGLASDDNSAGSAGARIVFTAAVAGTYTIDASDAQNEPVPADGTTRDYTLRIESGSTSRMCPGPPM